jgi:hypothetical protein
MMTSDFIILSLMEVSMKSGEGHGLDVKDYHPMCRAGLDLPFIESVTYLMYNAITL